MPDELRDAIRPELAIALERMAERYRTRQDRLPPWVKDLLAEYGEACAIRGARWVHERDTARPKKPAPQLTAASWDDEVTAEVDLWEGLK